MNLSLDLIQRLVATALPKSVVSFSDILLVLSPLLFLSLFLSLCCNQTK